MSVTLRDGQQAWWEGVLLQLSCSTDKKPEEATEGRSKMLAADVSKDVKKGTI